jgi:hypothetical protein
MAQTRHVEMREGERWEDVAQAFLQYCLKEKQVVCGGCHEGDSVAATDARLYATISIPDHSPGLLSFLHEWAAREGRAIW